MREIRQSGSEGGGNEQTVSPYPYSYKYLTAQSPMERSPWAFYRNLPSPSIALGGAS